MIRRLQVQGKQTHTKATNQYEGRVAFNAHSNQNNFNDQDEAYNVHSNNNNKYKGRKHFPSRNRNRHDRPTTDRSKIICWNCGVSGHFASDCNKRTDEGKGLNRNNNRTINTVVKNKARDSNNNYNAHFCL